MIPLRWKIQGKNQLLLTQTTIKNGTSDFILNILKNSITNEISKKDAIIDHLMSQLLLSKNASHNHDSDSKKNDNLNNKRKSSYTNPDSVKEKRKKNCHYRRLNAQWYSWTWVIKTTTSQNTEFSGWYKWNYCRLGWYIGCWQARLYNCTCGYEW